MRSYWDACTCTVSREYWFFCCSFFPFLYLFNNNDDMWYCVTRENWLHAYKSDCQQVITLFLFIFYKKGAFHTYQKIGICALTRLGIFWRKTITTMLFHCKRCGPIMTIRKSKKWQKMYCRSLITFTGERIDHCRLWKLNKMAN